MGGGTGRYGANWKIRGELEDKGRKGDTLHFVVLVESFASFMFVVYWLLVIEGETAIKTETQNVNNKMQDRCDKRGT